MSWCTVFTAALMFFVTAAYAEVADMTSSGFLAKHEVTVNATPANAYKALVDESRRLVESCAHFFERREKPVDRCAAGEVASVRSCRTAAACST